MKKLFTFLIMFLLATSVGWGAEVTDVLNRALTGISGTSYSNWSGKTATSTAVYAGNSAGGNSSIQLRDNSNSGIITTGSGGKVKSVSVTWNTGTSSARKLVVYGKNTAYTSTSQIYNTSSQGERLGYIYYKDSSEGTTTSITVTGDYEYICLRTVSGSVYLTNISIVWETESGSDPSTPTATVSFDPAAGEVASGTTVALSLSGTADGIKYTTNGDNPTSSSAIYSSPIEITEATTIKAAAYNYGNSTYALGTVAEAAYTIASSSPSGNTMFYESFTGSDGTLTSFSGNDGSGNTPKMDNSGWTYQNLYGASNAVKLGTGSKKGTMQTPPIGTLVIGQEYTLTFKVAPWASESSTTTLTATGATINGSTTWTSLTMATGRWNEYTLTFVATATTCKFKFEASNNRFFLDEVKVIEPIIEGAYNVTISETIEHGSVSASPSTAVDGTTITLTVTPDTGYELSSLTYTPEGGSATSITATNGVYSFTMPAANVTVNATFSKVNYNIYRTFLTNGESSEAGGWLGNWSENCTLPNGAQGNDYVVTTNYGETVQFKAGTENGYQILDANVTAVDGNNQPVNLTKVSSDNSGTVFSFTMPATTVTITANFTTYQPTIRLAGRFDGNTAWRTTNETCPAFDFNGTTYTIDAYFTGEGAGNYFFITEDGVEKHPTANGNWVVQNTTGTAIALGWQGSGNFQIDNGVYTITMPADRSTIAFTKHEPTVTISPTDGSEVEQGTTVTATSTLTGLIAAIKATDGGAAGDVIITCNPATLSTVGSGQTATATAAIGNYSVSATATYTVVAANNSNKYQRITSTSDLVPGKKYLLVCESGSYAHAGTGGDGESITINNHITELSSGSLVNVYTLSESNGSYYFSYNSNGTTYYLTYSGTGNGSVKCLATGTGWDISFNNDGNAVIKDGSNILRAYSGSTDFRIYTSSTNQTVQLYKQMVEVPKAFTIEYASVAGGSASGETEADAGDVITVTTTPGEGYATSSVTVTTDDANYQTLSVSGSGNSYTFTVPNDFAGTTITVTPAFASAYPITYVADPIDGGTVTGPASAVYDATVEVMVTPNSDYRLVGQPTYTYNGTTQNLTGSGPYTFNMPGYATTVTANFEKIPYGISVTSSHGEVTGLPATAVSGTSITFTVTPNAGYVVSSVSGTFNNGNSSLNITDNGDGTYTFGMPAYDVAITVTYFASEDYELLTDLSDINEEDTYLIVGGAANGTTKSYVMGTSGSSQANGVELTSSNYNESTGIISSTSDMALVNFAVKTENGATTYALHTAKGYLNNSSTSSNGLSYSANPVYATITLGNDSKATIQLVNNSSRGQLSYNTNGNMWKFYGGAQGANYIFKLANANKVKRPTVTGAAGEYLGLYNFIGKDNVTLACATDGATIEYSLDGGTTWLSYSEAFEITTNAAGNTVEVLARATKAGMDPSDVVTSTFTCIKPTAPTFGSNGAGAYVNPTFVYPKSALNDRRAYGEDNVTFCYTTDGNAPTATNIAVTTSNSNGYYIYLDKDANLKVVTVINGIASDPAGGEYTFSVAAPAFSLAGGNYDGNQQTRLSTETKTQQNNVTWNTVIYYTKGNTAFAFNETTGEVTSEGWIAYDPANPYIDIFAADGTTTIKAVTLSNYINGKEKYVASTESTETYVVTAANLSVTISPAAGTYVNAQTVTLGVKNNIGDYEIYYTTDGSDPSNNGTAYTGAITVDHDMTIKVYAVDSRSGEGGTATAEATYKIGIQPVVYSPIPGAYYAGDDNDITVEMFSVTPNAKVYYTVAEGEGNIPDDPTTSSTLYSGGIELETGKTYNFKAIAVVGNKVSAVTPGTYTINAKGNGWLNVEEMNLETNTSTTKSLDNPVQVVYMSTWRNNGTKPEFCFVRDNSGYGLVYFGGSGVTAYNDYTKFQMGDWLNGGTISGKVNVWNSSFINELGSSSGSVSAWPSTAVGNSAILPEETTNLAITQGWTYNGAYTGNDYASYIDADKNLFGHYVHMRKNTISNVTGAGGGNGKHIGIITDQSGVPLNYYDGLYLFSGYNGSPDYDQAFFNSVQNNGGTFDIYAIVYFYGPNANNSSYSNAPYEIFPIDFEWIYKPVFDKTTGTYYEPQTVSLTCQTEGAQIWYKTSEMEAYELYTGPFTVDATTTIEAYSTIPTKYNDTMESVIESITITIGSVEAPVITPASEVKTVGESVTASISCVTEGAVIYYTTDGSDPKTSTTRMVYSDESDMTFTTTTTVRAIAMLDDYYSVEAESKTYTFVKSNGIVYDLVTSDADLDENSVYVIVNKANHMAMSNTQKANNRDASGVQFVNESTKTQVYGNDDVAVFTLKKSGNNWLMQTVNGANVASNGYLHVGDGNLLLTSATADENAEATIAIGGNNTDVDKAYESHISFIYNSETTRYLRFWLRDLLFNAYTSETNQPVFLYKKEATPLAVIEKEGELNKDYTIADQLVVVYAQGGSLWCKDQGNVSIVKSEPTSENQHDYMREATGRTTDWDQSNWVELYFGENADLVTLLPSYVGGYIKPATITGVLKDKCNYRIEVEYDGTLPNLQVETGDSYVPNTYCTANFLESNLILKDGDMGALSQLNNEYYFFLNPKVQEYALITFAMWNGSEFVIPGMSEDGKVNGHNFDGSFNVKWTYNNGGDVSESLNMDDVYEFNAIIRRPAGSTYGPAYAPKTDQTPSSNLEVYPTNLSSGTIITGVDDVKAPAAVASVKYVDLSGRVSDKPVEGVNIVVTRYTNGTVRTTKVIR